MQKIIDIRSDTKTKPTRAMYQAMLKAELGDEQNNEDPSVLKLQEMAAKILGKEEAGLFVSSGTMGNLVALMTHAQPGDSVIVESGCHMLRCEVGGISAVAGLMVEMIKGIQGVPDLEELENAIMVEGRLFPTTKLICLENTHNSAGGTCISPQQLKGIRTIADKYGIKIHIDGARIFNAAVALNVEPEKLVKDVDSLQFCLSKGLACPFGSVLVGSNAFIETARKKRQMLGGGMRQAGVMAAAGIVALEEMINRLKEDHENAKILAEGLSALGMKIDMSTVQTNMVFFTVPEDMIEPSKLVEKLKEFGILFGPPKGLNKEIRVVTHKDVFKEDILEVIEKVKQVIMI